MKLNYSIKLYSRLNTKIPYRVLYLSSWILDHFEIIGKNDSSIFGDDSDAHTTDKIKKILSELKEDLVEKISDPKVLKHKAKEIDDAENFLSDNAINIIHKGLDKAVKFDFTPEGLSHDIGHRFIKSIGESLKDLVEPLRNDYIVKKDNEQISIELSDRTLREMLEAIIIGNFSKKRGIGRGNLLKGKFFDLVPDFLVQYHLEGDSLEEMKNMNIYAPTFYGDYLAQSGSISDLRFRSKKNKRNEIVIEPKDPSAPSLNEALRKLDFFEKSARDIEAELQSYIGKVILT